MAWDGVYVPTERAPAPGAPGASGPDEPGPAPDDGGGEGFGGATVYLPTQRVQPGDAEFLVEMRHLADGRLALLTYSSLDALVAGCGDAQPWVEVPAGRVDEVRAMAGADAVVMDEVLDPEQRHRAAESSEGGTGRGAP